MLTVTWDRTPVGRPQEDGSGRRMTVTAASNNNQRLLESGNKDVIYFVAFIRLACFVIWTCGILYSTYQLVLTTRDYLPWQSDPMMNPGPLSRILGRGRDSTDVEWVNFARLFFTKLVYWYAGYVVLSASVPGTLLPGISLILSFLLSVTIMDLKPTVYLFMQPVMYWFLPQIVKSKLAVWIISFSLLCTLNLSYVKDAVFGFNHTAEFYFDICLGWTYARCISFTFDRWHRKDNVSVKGLYEVLSYCFYFPLLYHGPIVLYNRYEADILEGGQSKNPNWQSFRTLFRSTAKLFVLILLTEGILHYIYFKPLSLTLPLLKEVNLWCLCAVIYWLGQYFMLKYQIFYGASTCVAQFDGLNMPPLPKCPAHIHRYSVLWKDFDRGLYNFLVQYTYIPTIKALDSTDAGKALPRELKKLAASLFAFLYVYVWHGIWFPIFVWAFFNFIGITVENIGSFLKRQLETKLDCTELFWDFVVEPIVTIPLAAMSILTSVIFTGSLEAAIIFTRRLLWVDVNDSAAFLFLFCFTQVGVTVRTWTKFRNLLKSEEVKPS